MLKILIFGAKGQLGVSLKQQLRHNNKIVSLHKDSKIHEANFNNSKNVVETIKKIKPDVIINAAAYTSVDNAELEKKIVKKVNSDTPHKIAIECKKNNILLIHFSSDYVFSGYGKRPWTEKSKLNPKNFYGKSKAYADKKILSSGCNYVIFRASWIYSEYGNNFVNTIINLSKKKKRIKVINDQIGSPSSTNLIALATEEVINDFRINKKNSKFINQIFNIASEGEVSWYGIAVEILSLLEKHNFKKKLLKKNILSISSKEYNQKAKRPLNSRLNINKLKKVFDLKILPWQEELKKVISKKLEGR